MLVSVLGEKGGTGKTTLATNLAGMRAAAGRKVLLIEADRQGSSERWAALRAESGLNGVECAPLYGRALARFLSSRVSAYDDAIIDVGAGDSMEMEAALEASDCVVVPVRPTAVDVWTMTLVETRIGEARQENPDLRAWAVINQASTNPRHTASEQARAALSSGCSELRVAAPVVCDRVAFQRAYSEGKTALEYKDRSGKAATEMADVFSVVFGEER